MAVEEKGNLELKLFISGATPGSLRAVSVVRTLCEERFPDRFSLEVTDVYLNPQAAREYQLFALPALIKLSPRPRRLFIGDMTDIRPLIAELEGSS